MITKNYHVKITLQEPMLGTVPKNESVYANYIAALATKRKENGETVPPETALALAEEEIESVPPEENKGWTGFHSDEEGPFLYDYQIKGFLKEAGNILKDIDEVKIKNLKAKIDNYVYVFPRRIRIPQPDDQPLERPLRAMTMQGPRVSLVRSDQVAAGSVIEFTISMLPMKELNEEVLSELLEFGVFKGLGQWRNGSYGRFVFELTKA